MLSAVKMKLLAILSLCLVVGSFAISSASDSEAAFVQFAAKFDKHYEMTEVLHRFAIFKVNYLQNFALCLILLFLFSANLANH